MVAKRNPGALFPTDEPLEPREMIGRGDDVIELYARLKAGTNVVMSAPRRTGKSTTVKAALDRLRQDGTYVVAVDLFSIKDASTLATQLIEEVVGNRPSLRRALHAANRTGQALYDALSLSAGAKLLSGPDVEGFDLTILPKLKQNPDAQINFAFGLMQSVAAADDTNLVLHIDEFQEINRIGETLTPGDSGAVKRKLRAALQRSPHVSSVFCGSHEHMLLTLFGDSVEPFYQWGSFFPLADITAKEWAEGLRVKFSDDGKEITDPALSMLIAAGAGHPRATMLLAQQAHLFSVLGDTQNITEQSVEQGYEMALRAEGGKHQAWADRVRNLGGRTVNRLGLPMAQIVAMGGHPYSLAPASEVRRALTALRDIGLVAEPERPGSRWKVIDPLFAEYLRRLA